MHNSAFSCRPDRKLHGKLFSSFYTRENLPRKYEKTFKKTLALKEFYGLFLFYIERIFEGSSCLFYSLLALHMQILSFRACDGTKFVLLEKSAV